MKLTVVISIVLMLSALFACSDGKKLERTESPAGDIDKDKKSRSESDDRKRSESENLEKEKKEADALKEAEEAAKAKKEAEEAEKAKKEAENSASQQTLNEAGEVVFRIPAGTGQGSWNTADNPIIIKPNQVLRLYNDDSTPHTVHTNSTRGGLPVHGCGRFFNTRNIGPQGVACQFGNVKPGPISEAALHDHFTWSARAQGTGRGVVYITVKP